MQKGDIMTIIGLNYFGMVNRAVFKYYGEYAGVDAVTENKKGARKKFRMPDLKHDEKDRLTFEGEFPFKIQGEIIKPAKPGEFFTSTVMHGDCLIRIYGNTEEIKDYIDKNNLNQNFIRWDAVMAMTEDVGNEVLTPVYPDVPTSSHPVQAVRDKIAA